MQDYERSDNSRLYDVWRQMILRCYDPTNSGYERYGARGIRVCDRWRKGTPRNKPHILFIRDMGPRPDNTYSLERKDNNGDYCPSNCKWATKTEQSRNTRTNRLLTFRGETKCIMDWSKEIGISRTTITSRLKKGWTVEMALTRRSTKRK